MGFTNFPNGVTSFGIPLYGQNDVPYVGGNTYFVKKAADSDYLAFFKKYNVVHESSGGNSVQPTADGVFALAQDNDRIIFQAPESGGHDLTKTITIDQFNLKVFGVSASPYLQKTTIKNPTTAADADMFIIKADKVQIAGLTFQNRQAGACITIGDTAGQSYYQIHIHDCNFTDYGSVATYGISTGPVANAANNQADAVNLVVERCSFDGFVTAAIVANGTRDAYLDNEIYVASTASGIILYKTSDGRGKGYIRRNYMYGPAGATTIGILVSAVGHAVCHSNIVENYFVGFTAADQPITKMTNLQGGGNWYAAAATGTWTIIDIVA